MSKKANRREENKNDIPRKARPLAGGIRSSLPFTMGTAAGYEAIKGGKDLEERIGWQDGEDQEARV